MKPRLLANENFPAPSVQHLRDRGHDIASVAEGGGGLSDSEVLARGVGEQFEGYFVLVDEAGLRKRPLPGKKSIPG